MALSGTGGAELAPIVALYSPLWGLQMIQSSIFQHNLLESYAGFIVKKWSGAILVQKTGCGDHTLKDHELLP